MNRQELNKLSTKSLCELAGINFELFKKQGFDRSILIEIILTPND